MTTELDPTAARANEAGWTPEAVKAAKAAEKARAKADKQKRKDDKKAADRAASAAFWGGLGRGVVAVWDFFMRNLLLAIVVSGVIGVAIFEWVNGGTGWGDFYPGLPTAVVWSGAAGSILLWYAAATQAIANIRKKESERDLVAIVGWTTSAVLAFVICVWGVFIATATNSIEAQQAAKASRLEFANLSAKIATLETDLEIYNSEYWKLSEIQIQRAIDSRVRTARSTVGLPDLDPAGGCGQAKLNFQQQRMCVRMNGGDDPTTGEAVLGIRTELENVQREVKTTIEKEAELQALQAEAKGFTVKQGDQTAEAMGRAFDDGEKSLTNAYWIFSSFLLLLSGWGCDWAIREILRLTREARLRKGKVA